MEADVLFEDARWEDAGFEAVALKSAKETLLYLGFDPDGAELSVLACNDSRIADLNSGFRGKPGPTNVLSWPAEDLGAPEDGGSPGAPSAGPDGMTALGDVAISYDTCLREARAAGKPLADHATHLMVHGILHLLGYDHERDADAALMQDLERKILGKMGVNDPYMEY